MTAKDVLQDARDSLLYCMELSEQIGVYRDMALKATKHAYEAVLELAGKCEELKEELSIMLLRSQKAEELIDTLESAKAKCVLRLIYISGFSVKKAAEKMHYTERWTHKLHWEAIRQLEKKYAEMNGGTDK